MTDVAQIERAEERLRVAMLAGDTGALEELLAADTVFTDQTGARLGKADDIEAHRSGLLQIERIERRGERLIRLLGDTAIVCVTLELAGSFNTQPFEGTFAYTRAWHRTENGHWQVEAAHCSEAAKGLVLRNTGAAVIDGGVRSASAGPERRDR